MVDLSGIFFALDGAPNRFHVLLAGRVRVVRVVV